MARSLSLLLTIAQVQAQVQSGGFAKGTLNIIYLSKVAYSGTGENRKKFYHLAKDKYSDCSDPSKFKILGFPCNQFGFQVRENTFSTQMSLSHLSFILSGAWGKRHRDLQQFEIRQTRRWLSS